MPKVLDINSAKCDTEIQFGKEIWKRGERKKRKGERKRRDQRVKKQAMISEKHGLSLMFVG